MSLQYEPASEPLHISVKRLFLNQHPVSRRLLARRVPHVPRRIQVRTFDTNYAIIYTNYAIIFIMNYAIIYTNCAIIYIAAFLTYQGEFKSVSSLLFYYYQA